MNDEEIVSIENEVLDVLIKNKMDHYKSSLVLMRMIVVFLAETHFKEDELKKSFDLMINKILEQRKLNS